MFTESVYNQHGKNHTVKEKQNRLGGIDLEDVLDYPEKPALKGQKSLRIRNCFCFATAFIR